MIRKCLQQVIKAATSTLTSHSRTAAYPHFRFSQQKHNFSLKDHLLEKEDNRKLSPSVSDPENTPQSESFETCKSQNCGRNTGRIHSFQGEQRPYFVVVAGILLLLNVAIRLSMPHDGRFDCYEKLSK